VYTYGQGSAAHLEIASNLSLDPLIIYRWNVVELFEVRIKRSAQDKRGGGYALTGVLNHPFQTHIKYRLLKPNHPLHHPHTLRYTLGLLFGLGSRELVAEAGVEPTTAGL